MPLPKTHQAAKKPRFQENERVNGPEPMLALLFEKADKPLG